MRIAADEQNGAARSVSAGFELTGSAKEGGLTLYTPIGGIAAILAWSKDEASLTSASDQRHFPSLEALINHTVGTPIPVEALFAWLNGIDASSDGWTADLSGHANGRITAQRTTPAPPAELRIVLDR